MKISMSECSKAAVGKTSDEERILPKDIRKAKAKVGTHLTPLEQGIAVAEEALKAVPDTRDELIADLKARIDRGEYKVSGEDIADMMLRRRAADRIR